MIALVEDTDALDSKDELNHVYDESTLVVVLRVLAHFFENKN